MLSASAAHATRSSLFAFHFELSRMPRRKPSSPNLRGARGVVVRSTMPRGSNTRTGLLSWCITEFLLSELAHAVGASVAGYRQGLGDGSQHRRAHVPPSGDEC